jgi:hypothetical protein
VARDAATAKAEDEHDEPSADRAASLAPETARSEAGSAAPDDPDEPDEPAELAEPVREPAGAHPQTASAPSPEPKAQAATTADGGAGGGQAARDPSTGVTIVPGIARYHRSECILIRFLGPEDLETMTIQAAEEAGCIPCRACRPEQILDED